MESIKAIFNLFFGYFPGVNKKKFKLKAKRKVVKVTLKSFKGNGGTQHVLNIFLISPRSDIFP